MPCDSQMSLLGKSAGTCREKMEKGRTYPCGKDVQRRLYRAEVARLSGPYESPPVSDSL